MILLLIVWDINKTINLRSKEEFVVFNIPGKAVYNYVSDSENIVITGDSIKKNEEDVLNEIRYYTENFWLKNKITGTKVFRINNIQSKLNQHTNAFYFKNNYMNLGGIKLYRPDKQPFKNLIPHKKLQLDYILISKDSDISVEKLSSCFEFKKVIIDSSIPYYKRIKWKKRFRENNIKYYDVNEKGAFKLEFDQKKVEKI